MLIVGGTTHQQQDPFAPTEREAYGMAGAYEPGGTFWQQSEQQPINVGYGAGYNLPQLDLMGDTQAWWDLAGIGRIDPGQFQAPTVSAPQVRPPSIPQTPSVTPGLYTDALGEQPESELEALINQILGREPEAPPVPQVDEDFINRMIEQYGLEPRSPEEIRSASEAIAARQAFRQEQMIQREIDRFEREFPNEFRKAQEQVFDAANKLSADRQEEVAARGMFYSSIMAGSASEIDSQVMEHINDIAVSAASRVAGLRDEMRDVEQWRILEEEVIFLQLEAEDRRMRQQLMHMQVEVATWADQMALDAWYRHENVLLQHDQLQLQGIQLKQMEAERLGQHYAMAMMADHPLVQGTLQDMGIPPQQFAGMSMEAQSALVNSVVGFNQIEQQMRMNEFQMRAVVAEIQLQNANLQLQASIASGQFEMQAMGMQLQAMMHRDQMALGWAGHALDVAGLEHGIAMDRARLSMAGAGTGAAPQEIDPFQYYMTAVDYWGQGHDYDVARQIAAQHPEALRMFESSVQRPTQQQASPTQDTGGGFWDWLTGFDTSPAWEPQRWSR